MSFTQNNLKELLNSEEYKREGKIISKLLFLWEKIYTRRKDLGFTQSELAKKAQIPQNKISDLEHWSYWEPKLELLTRLSNALEISVDYLLSDNITRRTVELYNYIFSQIKKTPDIMQYMKIPYFVDLKYIKKHWIQLSNFSYKRWHYWPFDKKVYDYQKLFSDYCDSRITNLKYIYLTQEDQDFVDTVLADLPVRNSVKLKKLSYETEPMQKVENLWDKLNLIVILEKEEKIVEDYVGIINSLNKDKETIFWKCVWCFKWVFGLDIISTKVPIFS